MFFERFNSRRRFLRRAMRVGLLGSVGGSAIVATLAQALETSPVAPGAPDHDVEDGKGNIGFQTFDHAFAFDNQFIRLRIDHGMKINVHYHHGGALLSMNDSAPGLPNYDLIVAGQPLAEFVIEHTELRAINSEFGEGQRLILHGVGSSAGGAAIKKILTLELYERFPTALISSCTYHNLSTHPIAVDRSIESQYVLNRKMLAPGKESFDFSLFEGGGVNYQQSYFGVPITSTTASENAQGVTIAQRDPVGGGIPMVDVWGKEMGMGIAHLSSKPEFVQLPVQTRPDGKVRIALEQSCDQHYQPIVIAPRSSFTTLRGLTVVHSLDAHDALHTYARLMHASGVQMLKKTPATVPGSYWKTWGYETRFRVADILARLPELKELGIAMVLLDDGWFSNYGDWEPSCEPDKFPNGEQDLLQLISTLHQEGFKVGMWWCPQIAAPDSSVAKTHPEWMMQDAKGKTYLLKDSPRSYLLCPTLPAVQTHWRDMIDKLYQRWDIDYIYHDWANLIEAPPCFDPRHKHASPLEPFAQFPLQFKLIYDRIQSIKPGSGIEMCECGRPHDPYKMPFYNVANASDPATISQILDKLKIEKALNGPECYFAAGYVQPQQFFDYDPGTLRLTLGTGSHFQTYYRELESSKPEWIRLSRLYNQLKLYQGTFLNLYDAVYDSPKIIVTRKDGVLYYYVPGPWSGEIELRGLGEGRYAIVDYLADKIIGHVEGARARLHIACTEDSLIKAVNAPSPHYA